jgi:phage baseplate assembly protein W
MTSSNFSFKSSGKKTADILQKRKESAVNLPFVGVKMPLALGNESFLAMNRTSKDQISDNLKNLLMTNHGERLGSFNYGCNLRELLAESNLSDEEFQRAAAARIAEGVSQWMSFVQLEAFSWSASKQHGPYVLKRLLLSYSAPDLGIREEMVEVYFEVVS